MALFSYIGDEERAEAFGLWFVRGASVEVTDAHAIRKLQHSYLFAEVFDGVEVVEAEQPKRRGRPPKAQ